MDSKENLLKIIKQQDEFILNFIGDIRIPIYIHDQYIKEYNKIHIKITEDALYGDDTN